MKKDICYFKSNFDYNARYIFNNKNNQKSEKKIMMDEKNQTLETKSEKKTKIIVFEGIDGSGKTTQIKILKKFFEFKGFSYHLTREPGGSILAEKIRELFLSTKDFSIESQILLCTAARIEHLKYLEEINQDNKYDFIIFDRFIDSTLAYQLIPNKMNPEILHSLNRKFKINLKIDMCILLDIDPVYSLNRKKNINNHFDENSDYLYEVRNAYMKIFKNHIDGKNNIEKKILIKSHKNPKVVFSKIIEEFKKANFI